MFSKALHNRWLRLCVGVLGELIVAASINLFIVPHNLYTGGLLGTSAMAGYVGGGGVGDLALTYGYEKMNTPLMILTVILLILFVQLLQFIGNRLSRRLREHR